MTLNYLPWWVLLACLLASALAAYLTLRSTDLSSRVRLALALGLAPLVLLGSVVIALVFSVSLGILHENLIDPAEPPARTERTRPVTTFDRTTPVTTGPTASPTASPTATPTASPTASPTATATASPTPGA